jgi:hypothetical protein
LQQATLITIVLLFHLTSMVVDRLILIVRALYLAGVEQGIFHVLAVVIQVMAVVVAVREQLGATDILAVLIHYLLVLVVLAVIQVLVVMVVTMAVQVVLVVAVVAVLAVLIMARPLTILEAAAVVVVLGF